MPRLQDVDVDNKILDIIINRMDKMEEKIDKLLEFKWKIVGGTIIASLILTTIFQIAIAMIERN